MYILRLDLEYGWQRTARGPGLVPNNFLEKNNNDFFIIKTFNYAFFEIKPKLLKQKKKKIKEKYKYTK